MANVPLRLAARLQVEGFPPKDQLKTVYVEHDIDAEAADLWPVEFIFRDPTFEGMPKEEVRCTLKKCCKRALSVFQACYPRDGSQSYLCK